MNKTIRITDTLTAKIIKIIDSNLLYGESMGTDEIASAASEIVSLFQKQMEEKANELEELKKPDYRGKGYEIVSTDHNQAISDAQEVLKRG